MYVHDYRSVDAYELGKPQLRSQVLLITRVVIEVIATQVGEDR
jgi:hypothetical protein